MACAASCFAQADHLGLRDCCHTCLFCVAGACTAPPPGGFAPRTFWRMIREA